MSDSTKAIIEAVKMPNSLNEGFFKFDSETAEGEKFFIVYVHKLSELPILEIKPKVVFTVKELVETYRIFEKNDPCFSDKQQLLKQLQTAEIEYLPAVAKNDNFMMAAILNIPMIEVDTKIFPDMTWNVEKEQFECGVNIILKKEIDLFTALDPDTKKLNVNIDWEDDSPAI